MTTPLWIVVAVAAVVLVLLAVGLVLRRRRRISLEAPPTAPEVTPGYRAGGGFTFTRGGASTAPPPAPPGPAGERTETDGQPGVGDDASIPRDEIRRDIRDVALPEVTPSDPTTSSAATTDAAPVVPPTSQPAPPPERDPVPAVHEEPGPDGSVVAVPSVEEQAPVRETIEPSTGRLERLRGRLSRSQSAVGASLLGLLGAGDLDEDSWEEVEDTLLIADLGTATTTAVVARLRELIATRTVRSSADVRDLLREVLVAELHPEMERAVAALPHDDHPSVLLVVGVNGTGKTTTTGKLARVLVADGRRVLLGAADTFRAAAAEQLTTWGARAGAEVVRGKEGSDPAAVAFDAVVRGTSDGVDVVLIDTAGRLHTKTGLMDELGKVKRVVEKKAAVDEVLLVLDATTGQNGLTQARVFRDVVAITGVVLTKLDGTAKGGIVFQVQRELGVPVKLVGLGEGADDLAPFEPGAYVDALLG